MCSNAKALLHALPALGAASALAEKRQPKVVIIGAGLTGSLTAAFLRRQHPKLQIEVWERATYPAGRFGAGLGTSGRWADLGAQVLSVIDVHSGHPNAGADGHNIHAADVCAAWDEAQSLVAAGMLQPVSDALLGDTEERMKYEGLWVHHWCPVGLGRLLLHYLDGVELRPGVRAECVTASADGCGVSVGGVGPDRLERLESTADALVVAVPAPDAADLLQNVLPPATLDVLRRIEYDRRAAIAFVFHDSLREAASSVFAGAGEVTFDTDIGASRGSSDKDLPRNSLHMLAWQDMKHAVAYGDPVVIVAHSTIGAGLADLEEAVMSVLADASGISKGTLAALLQTKKVVDWDQCQMTRPVEGLITDLKVDGSLDFGRVIVAGDFWTQSSFLGCFCSAASACRAACRLLPE